jgi:hemerythrin-like domain-containing protein
MKSIAEFMATDHKACDNEFAAAEEAALDGDWGKTEAGFNSFRNDMAHHFRMEEDVLFPTLQAAGGPSGPVQMMLMEHVQMNDLIADMAAAVAGKDSQKYSGLSETLLIVMQQHNHKEEQILYPIADRILSGERDSILGRMQAV